MSTSFVGDITHIPFMNTSTTGMCALQTTDEVDIGGHYNSTLEQGQCFVLTVLTLPQTAPERMSNVGHSRAAVGRFEGRCPLTCTGHSRALATHRVAHHLVPWDATVHALVGPDSVKEQLSFVPILGDSGNEAMAACVIVAVSDNLECHWTCTSWFYLS